MLYRPLPPMMPTRHPSPLTFHTSRCRGQAPSTPASTCSARQGPLYRSLWGNEGTGDRSPSGRGLLGLLGIVGLPVGLGLILVLLAAVVARGRRGRLVHLLSLIHISEP